MGLCSFNGHSHWYAGDAVMIGNLEGSLYALPSTQLQVSPCVAWLMMRARSESHLTHLGDASRITCITRMAFTEFRAAPAAARGSPFSGQLCSGCCWQQPAGACQPAGPARVAPIPELPRAASGAGAAAAGSAARATAPHAGPHSLRSASPLMSLLQMGLLLLSQHTVQQHCEGLGPDWLALADD